MRGLKSSSPVRRKRGQGMTEYIIVIAIVAIGAIAIIGLFGKQIKHAFRRMGGAIDGEVVKSQGDIMSGEAGKQDAMNTFDSDANKGAE